VIEIMPPHKHINLQVVFRIPMLPARTVTDPGVHGLTVLGMHGCGVNTPIAALVAAATCGLLNVVHIPNGAILTIGLLSISVATGWLLLITRLVGNTVNVAGATPNEQVSMAPFVTVCGIALL
jgi:hypothetical protein